MIDLETALRLDGEKLRQETGSEHGPFCPRCLVSPLGSRPVFLGTQAEGHICEFCWADERSEDYRP